MAECPAYAGRPRFDIADIVRAHRAQLERDQGLSVVERRVLSAIERCRTAALGGHLDVCRSCGQERPAYNSCRNRHCPKCQALAQERWISARTERLLPVRHFHVVFTLPSELRGLCRWLPRPLFDALFRAASETLLELGRTHLAATLGITMVLHTWMRNLRFHPHVHAIVTAGGLREDDRWASSNSKYIFPVAVMGALLRGKMMAQLHRLHTRGKLRGYDEFEDLEAFGRFMAGLPRRPWLVYAKRTFGRAEHVLRYLGRYTQRVAIANSRLVDVTPRAVTFRTRNGATASLTPMELLRRFLQHVLPDGFKKIRHYGLYAPSAEERHAMARRILNPETVSHLSANVVVARTPPRSHPTRRRPVSGVRRPPRTHSAVRALRASSSDPSCGMTIFTRTFRRTPIHREFRFASALARRRSHLARHDCRRLPLPTRRLPLVGRPRNAQSYADGNHWHEATRCPR